MANRFTEAWQVLTRASKASGLPVATDTHITEQRSSIGTADINDPVSFWKLFGVDVDLANVVVTPQVALGLEAFQACLDIISSAVAQVPLSVYEETERGKEVAAGHPLFSLVKLRPNRQQGSFLYRKTRVIHQYLYGHALSEIVRGPGNRPVEFKIIQPGDYSILESADGTFLYQKKNGKVLAEEDVIHTRGISLDGKFGYGLPFLHKRVIKLGITSQEFLNKYYAKGTHIQGYITSESKLSPSDANALGDQWDDKYSSGVDGVGKTPVLGQGTEYKAITRTPVESQMVEFLTMHPSKIYQMFRVPPHLVGDTTKATSFGSGIEDMSIMFVTYTLLPLAVQFEEEMNYKAFRSSEIGRFYVKHNFNGLQRGNFAGRMEAFGKGIQAGIYSPNDARKLEDMNSYEEGDTYMVNGNMIPVSMAGQQQQSNGTTSNQ